MTREEILALKPGSEMDALVAEKVMGWPFRFHHWAHRGDGTADFEKLDDPANYPCWNRDSEGAIHVWRGPNLDGKPWSPSTDIAAAMEVVDHFPPEYNWTLIRCASEGDPEWSGALTSYGKGMGIAFGGGWPEAICKASLLVLVQKP